VVPLLLFCRSYENKINKNKFTLHFALLFSFTYDKNNCLELPHGSRSDSNPLKGLVHCFSIQVVMKKSGADPFCFPRKTRTYFRKMTSPSRRLDYSNNQLNC